MTPTQRASFANAPLNLWAVDGGLNMQKGDGDAATWLPPHKPVRCDYVAYQVAVKHKYDLWVNAAEKTAIVNLVTSSCPRQKDRHRQRRPCASAVTQHRPVQERAPELTSTMDERRDSSARTSRSEQEEARDARSR